MKNERYLGRGLMIVVMVLKKEVEISEQNQVTFSLL